MGSCERRRGGGLDEQMDGSLNPSCMTQSERRSSAFILWKFLAVIWGIITRNIQVLDLKEYKQRHNSIGASTLVLVK